MLPVPISGESSPNQRIQSRLLSPKPPHETTACHHPGIPLVPEHPAVAPASACSPEGGARWSSCGAPVGFSTSHTRTRSGFLGPSGAAERRSAIVSPVTALRRQQANDVRLVAEFGADRTFSRRTRHPGGGHGRPEAAIQPGTRCCRHHRLRPSGRGPGAPRNKPARWHVGFVSQRRERNVRSRTIRQGRGAARTLCPVTRCPETCRTLYTSVREEGAGTVYPFMRRRMSHGSPSPLSPAPLAHLIPPLSRRRTTAPSGLGEGAGLGKELWKEGSP